MSPVTVQNLVRKTPRAGSNEWSGQSSRRVDARQRNRREREDHLLFSGWFVCWLSLSPARRGDTRDKVPALMCALPEAWLACAVVAAFFVFSKQFETILVVIYRDTRHGSRQKCRIQKEGVILSNIFHSSDTPHEVFTSMPANGHKQFENILVVICRDARHGGLATRSAEYRNIASSKLTYLFHSSDKPHRMFTSKLAVATSLFPWHRIPVSSSCRPPTLTAAARTGGTPAVTRSLHRPHPDGFFVKHGVSASARKPNDSFVLLIDIGEYRVVNHFISRTRSALFSSSLE